MESLEKSIEELRNIPKVEIYDLDPLPIEEEYIEESSAEETRLSFTPSEKNELKSIIEIDDEFDDEKFKKEVLPNVDFDCISLAKCFVRFKDLTDSIHSTNSTIMKLKAYVSLFDDLESIRVLLEEYGDGSKYNSHLYLHDIKKILGERRKDVVKLVKFLSEVFILDEDMMGDDSDEEDT